MNKKTNFGGIFYGKKPHSNSEKKNSNPLRHLILLGFVLSLLMVSLLSSKEVSATHFRYGNISWKRVPGFEYRIEFKVSQAWRRSFYANPNVGAQVTTGVITFGTGQGFANVNLTVTSVNAGEDWFYGEATIVKDYPLNVPANYLVEFMGCCRISTLDGGNNDQPYINRTMVTVGNQNDAPVSTMPPYINRPNNVISTFQIPATDPNGHTLTYSLASLAETGLVAFTPGLTITPGGLVTFDPTGKGIGTEWACAVKVQDQLGAFIVVDFIIRVVGPSTPPIFTAPTPANNTTFLRQPGQALTFTVRAIDNDNGDNVFLSGVGIPVGATFAPVSGNPALSTFSWTPLANQLGTYVINFIAQDAVGVQTITVANVVVSLKPEFVVPPTPGNNSTFCVLPGASISNTITAGDPDLLDAVVLTANAIPGMTFSPALPTVAANPTSTTLTYAPVAANWGLKHLIMTATDTYNETEQVNIYYIVNNPPTFTSVPITTAIINQLYTYVVTTADLNAAEGDEVDVESFSIPAFLTLVDNNNGTFTISGTPTINDTGSYSIFVEIQDSMNHINGTHCGNALQTFTLNVQGTPPVITCPADITADADSATCAKANVAYTATATGIPAPVITYSIAPGSTFAVGTTTVTAYAQNVLGIDSCTFTVTIEDHQAPVPLCKNFSLNLSGGLGTVQVSDINDGSYDNCGIDSMSVYPNSFTCEDEGPQIVTLTVVDFAGNSASCQATVTVQYVPDCSIAVVPSNNVYTGGVANNIYLGYGPQSATLNSSASGGAGFTYSWSPANYLSCNTCEDPIFAPTAAGTITYTLTVTNGNGCETECEVTMCVIDARATGKGNAGKVIICHVPPGNPNNPQTLSVSTNAVASHLTQHAGDKLGACGVSCGAPKSNNPIEGQLLENEAFETIVYPNPAEKEFTIVVTSESKSPINASMHDMTGKKIRDMNDILPNTPYTLTEQLATGMYLIKIEQNGFSQNVRLIKQ